MQQILIITFFNNSIIIIEMRIWTLLILFIIEVLIEYRLGPFDSNFSVVVGLKLLF